MKKELNKLLHNYDFVKEEIECIIEYCEECIDGNGIKQMIDSINNGSVYDRDTIITYANKLAGLDNQKIIIEKC